MIIYKIILEILLAKIAIYFLQKVQILTLKQNKVFIKVLTKYLDFFDIFFKKKVLVLFKQIEFNKYVIKPKKDK